MRFLISILKLQVSSSSVFVSFFIVMTHNSSVNFKLIHFLFWTKGSYQSENLPNSSCHFPNDKSVFLQILYHSSVSWNITPLSFFSSNNIYFILIPLKWKFLRLLSAQIKICQIPHVNFETTNRFLSKFCILFQFHER